MTNNQYRFVSPINFGFAKTIGPTEGVYLSAALKISEALSMVTLPALNCLNTKFFYRTTNSVHGPVGYFWRWGPFWCHSRMKLGRLPNTSIKTNFR